MTWHIYAAWGVIFVTGFIAGYGVAFELAARTIRRLGRARVDAIEARRLERDLERLRRQQLRSIGQSPEQLLRRAQAMVMIDGIEQMTALQDPNLSTQARHLLMTVMSKPAGTVIHTEELIRMLPSWADYVRRRAIKEAQKAGYIVWDNSDERPGIKWNGGRHGH